MVKGKFELVPPVGLRGQEIHWLAKDVGGRIWVGTEKEMAAWNGERFENEAPLNEGDLNVASLSFTRDGGVWVAANERLRKLLGGKWVAELKGWPDLMREHELQGAVYEDREGGVWRVSRSQGITHIDGENHMEQISMSAGLPGNHTTCWLEDQEGNFWVGLGNGGVAQLRKKHFETLTLPGSPVRPAVSVCEDGAGALWVGTYGGGLSRWLNGSVTNFSIPTPAAEGFVFSIYPAASGGLWLSAGLEDLFNFREEKLAESPVAVHAVKSMLVDRQNRLWLGRKDGVECWANGKLQEWSSHDGSIERPVRALAEDKRGVVWIGADDGYVYCYENEELRSVQLPDFMGQQSIWALLADEDGSLWIGTSDAGLLHFVNGSFSRFTAKDGLPDDLICQILDDGRGNLWLGTHQGICRVSKGALRDFAAHKAPMICGSTYGRADGLPTLQCAAMYQPSAWRGHDGKLWFATAKGVVGVQPAEMPLNVRPPPVVIEEFLADGEVQPRTEASEAAGGRLKVPPGKQNFEFHYTALSLTAAGKNHFRYKLEGFDSNWIEAGSRRWVPYNYLKPGVYRFRVMAGNNDGVWNEAGDALSVQILPHFWETWWFRLLLGLTAVAAIAAVVRQISRREVRLELERLAHQRDLEMDRARIARDIHDHIGSGLTRINLLNELLLGEPPDYWPQRISQITGITCELMQAMDEIVWAVNPKNDSLENLMTYLCDFADDYLRTAKIRLRINVPARLPDWDLTAEVRHNLFLAVREMLNNIVKHSRASEVILSLKLDDENFALLEVRDDGCGIAAAAPTHRSGNGLDNLQKRADAIGGQIRIHSEPEKGMTIELSIPKRTRSGAAKSKHNNSLN
jgi:signal transduction histidine kinase/ligand-binding sensor domain-containing protein